MLRYILFVSLVYTTLLSSSGDATFWQEVRDTNDIELLELYKIKYPKGNYIYFANQKINKLKNSNDIANIKRFEKGKYSCSKITLYLDDNNKAYYINNNSKIHGQWLSNGVSANIYFQIPNKFDESYTISYKYGEYIIYKNNRIYCAVNK